MTQIKYNSGKTTLKGCPLQGKGKKVMNESYAEASVKKKSSPLNLLLKVVVIAIFVFMLLFGSMFLGLYAIIFAGLLLLVIVLVFPFLNIEYEYVFCDGQLDFDKIYSGNKRKTALRIDFEYVEIMAPVNSHALDSYNQRQQLKVLDYSSGQRTNGCYAVIIRQGEQLTKILFEPNEKMIAAIKQKAPRKISEY